MLVAIETTTKEIVTLRSRFKIEESAETAVKSLPLAADRNCRLEFADRIWRNINMLRVIVTRFGSK